jgi:zinc protease
MTSVVPALTKPVKPRRLSTVDRTLENGLRVVAVRKPGVPLAEIRLRIAFLSAKAAHSARATLLSDTMLTGSPAHDRSGLAGAVQALGGDLNVGVDADRLVLSANVLSSNLVALLDLLREVLVSATYPDDEVDGERDRLLENLTIARSRSQVVANEALAQLMFGTHPYAVDLPQPADVRAVTASQLRRLHADQVRPVGAVMVVVGDLPPVGVIARVEHALGSWTGKPLGSRVPKLPPIIGSPSTIIDRPGAVQSSIRMGASALRRDDARYPALQLANAIFGGYFSSRWTENIREDKGYTYGPHSRLEHHVLGSTLTLDVDVATEVTAPAVLETIYELGRISLLPVTETELESVRQYSIGSLALSVATQAGLASTLSGLIGVGLGPDWLVEHTAHLASVTLAEVNEAAREFLAPTRFVGVIVGDEATIREPLSAIITLA